LILVVLRREREPAEEGFVAGAAAVGAAGIWAPGLFFTGIKTPVVNQQRIQQMAYTRGMHWARR
jgi:hypothetical protein